MTKRKPIYVEARIHTTMEELWEATQSPAKHELWDLRFSEIDYLPKADEPSPQRFLYKTNIGFGLSISGEGESQKTVTDEASRTSSLRFSSSHPLSLISTGSGYWKYVQQEDHVQFLTLYSYDTRWGWLGRLINLIFQPIMGWATAWSFDCLKLWLEKGIHPSTSIYRALIHVICTWTLAFVWIYQGLIPKLLYPNSGELAILVGTGLFPGYESIVLVWVGFAEMGFGIAHFLFHKTPQLFITNILLLGLLPLGALFSSPQLILQPFNPVTFNLALIAIALMGWLSLRDLVDAQRCKRKVGDPA